MGGVFSCVADLATWSAGFAAAFPPDGAAGGRTATPHPLAAASRRQMQLPQAVTGWRAPDRLPGGPPAAPSYYGFGLFVDEDPALGRVVSHSGGYPGFGSNMRWHPATGLGVIALGNGTYAPMSGAGRPGARGRCSPARRRTTSRSRPRPGPTTGARPPAASPASAAGRGRRPWRRRRWSATCSPTGTTRWPTRCSRPNVALDRPYPERRADLALLRSRIGAFTVDASRPAESDTPAHRRWWLAGEHGTVAVAIQLSPQRPPRVQSLTFAVPPAPARPSPGPWTTVTAWLNGGSAGPRLARRRCRSRRRPTPA